LGSAHTSTHSAIQQSVFNVLPPRPALKGWEIFRFFHEPAALVTR
jgi:hypothetical protein